MKGWFRSLALCIFLYLTLVSNGQAAQIIEKIPITEKYIAVTLEDVENPEDMRKVMRLCQQHDVKMTFFIQAKFMEDFPILIRQAAGEGHEFGNHGVSYRYWGEVNTAEIKKELDEAADVIQKLTGRKTDLFKPTYNYYETRYIDAVNMISPQVFIIRGVDMADWTLTSPDAMVEKAKASASDGAILHFSFKAKQSMRALPDVITELKQQGYKLVTVSEMKMKISLPQPQKPQLLPKPPLKSDFYGVIEHINTSQPAVALTFDDGGSPYRVSAILDILKSNRAKATFFLLGNWVNENPDLVRRMLADGHEIANHSYSHPRFTRLSQEDMKQEILAAQTAMAEATGQSPSAYFRPPYGSYNGSVISVLKELGYEAAVMWDIDTRDWTGRSAASITNHVLNRVSGGAIVLFHLHAANTLEALEELIPALQRQGYKLMTIGNMLK